MLLVDIICEAIITVWLAVWLGGTVYLLGGEPDIAWLLVGVLAGKAVRLIVARHYGEKSADARTP